MKVPEHNKKGLITRACLPVCTQHLPPYTPFVITSNHSRFQDRCSELFSVSGTSFLSPPPSLLGQPWMHFLQDWLARSLASRVDVLPLCSHSIHASLHVISGSAQYNCLHTRLFLKNTRDSSSGTECDSLVPSESVTNA